GVKRQMLPFGNWMRHDREIWPVAPTFKSRGNPRGVLNAERRQHSPGQRSAIRASEWEGAAKRGLQFGREHLLKALTATEQAGLHCGDRQFQDCRGFLAAQPFDLAQHEHGAKGVGKLRYRFFEQLADLLARDRRVGRIRLRAAHERFTIDVHYGDALPYQMTMTTLFGAAATERLVDHDTREPSRQSRLAFERANVGEGRNIGGLDGFLGLRTVLENAPRSAEEPLIVDRDDVLDRAAVARRAKAG